MATFGLLGRGASCLSSSTVDLVDGSGIADLEVLFADEGWHCLRVELETRCGVVGRAAAIEGESRLFFTLSAANTTYGGYRSKSEGHTSLQLFAVVFVPQRVLQVLNSAWHH